MMRHESQRGYFAYALWEMMGKNSNIYFITGDLGYKVFDQIMKDYPLRFINTGAAEQTAMDIAIGLSYMDKIPFVYSITPFLLYRAFEGIRTYINHEKLNVKLIGSGRNSDYAHDGFSHNADDDKLFMQHMGNIQSYWPSKKEQIPSLVKEVIAHSGPDYINLTR